MPLRHKCVLSFSTLPCKAEVLEGFFDKYLVDNCALTKCILETNQPNNAYQARSQLSFSGGALASFCAPQWLGSGGESVPCRRHPDPNAFIFQK
jgi:hypothetical protein